MPSLFAASSTVLPCGTCTARPSTSMLSNCAVIALYVVRHEAALVLDVMRELAAEVLDEALHRQLGGIAERADRAALDVVGNGREHVEVLKPSRAVLDAAHRAQQPSGTLAPRRALAAGLFGIELRQPHHPAHHAARLDEDDHRAGAEHRS